MTGIVRASPGTLREIAQLRGPCGAGMEVELKSHEHREIPAF